MRERELTRKEFTNEMRILWRGLDVEKRGILGKLIRNFYDKGDRANKIILKLQSPIED